MTDFPNSAMPPLVTIQPWSIEAIGSALSGATGGALASTSSRTWQVANSAVFYPFVLDQVVTATQLFVHNGATASGNMDIGIYSVDGTRLTSAGTTAQAGTNALQLFDITDYQLGPGKFWMALAMNGTTGTCFSAAPTASYQKLMGTAEMASAFVLPATVTFATATNMVNIPIFGFTTNAVI